MKLLTTIPPRADGTVIARIPDTDKAYTFKGEPPVCDVQDDKHVKYLLGTKQFIPAEAEDYEKAETAIKQTEDPGWEEVTVDVDEVEEGKLPDGVEAFDVATADAKSLREFIKQRTGTAPAPATGIDKLRSIAETVAD
ncbi:hypothetical protein [Uliginosibacterium sp. 31-12]|uniref:hypothetical protein n=1 Tax=Uliginosibacterium sp. 31-12 TaxID=3062781 RepID=UPI0026E2C549|nr:hypothetical protein [Uliginosibacterium sp. 31-12]MDO6385583.1 hypothetical protein [Uliginosibacterium sp. 31-12]